MNPNPDLLLNPPLNPLINPLTGAIPELPALHNLSFHSLLTSAAAGNRALNHHDPWEYEQIYPNYAANPLLNQPCLSTTSPNYSANHSAASVNSPPNYHNAAANYGAAGGMIHHQLSHDYDHLINLCASSASAINDQHANNPGAGYANVGFDYIPNYDNLAANHYSDRDGAAISDDVKGSLSRANSSSLITPPKPQLSEVINNKQEPVIINVPASSLTSAGPPNSEVSDPTPKPRKKRSRSEVNSDPAKEEDEAHEQSSSTRSAIPRQMKRRRPAAAAKVMKPGAARADGDGWPGSTGAADAAGPGPIAAVGSSRGGSPGGADVGPVANHAAAIGGVLLPAPSDHRQLARGVAATDGGDKPAGPAGGPAGAPAAQLDYIHVRARRGQATDSHSLAERVRREKIGERMKYLQDLVPGCSKVTGKAMMLDEIINYVQSLQRQVEFLSMKLASVHPNKVESVFKECNIQSGSQIGGGAYNNPIPSLPLNQVSINTSCAGPALSDHTFGSECMSQISGHWDDADMQSIMQTGFARSNALLLNGTRQLRHSY